MAMRLMIDRYNYFELGTEPFKVLFFFVILFFIILINNTPDINPPIWAAAHIGGFISGVLLINIMKNKITKKNKTLNGSVPSSK